LKFQAIAEKTNLSGVGLYFLPHHILLIIIIIIIIIIINDAEIRVTLSH